jgi:transposase InsO family protein
MKVRDEKLKEEILSVLSDHPAYGHKRLAWHLGRNKKCIRRIMKKFSIQPYRRRKQHYKKGDKNLPALHMSNYAKILCPIVPNVLWASDFTYFWFARRWWYLATVIDIYTREIVGFSFSAKHDQELVLSALQDALNKRPSPIYLHSDQGSEYRSYRYGQLLKKHHILASFSEKSSPWQNGFQESFYSEFKKDLGDPNQFETIGEFLEAIYLQLHYYNNRRIHTSLKMPPAKYARQYFLNYNKLS